MWSRSCQIGFRFLAIGSLALAAGAVFYEQTNKHVMAQERADLHGRIVAAQRLIEAMRRDEEAGQSVEQITPLNTNLPSGSAQVWLPELARKHFTEAGLATAIVRLNSIHEIPERTDYQRGYWSIGIPVDESPNEIPKLLTAVAQFEKQNSFIHVMDLAITPDPENPSKRIGGINVTTLVAE